MGKKMALLFSVLLAVGLACFFRSGTGAGQEARRQTLEPGSLSGAARQAEALYQRLPKTLDPRSVRLCFRGEELACDRDTDTWYLPVNMDSALWESGTFTDFEENVRILPLVDYTALEKQETVAEGRSVPLLAWSEAEESCAQIHVIFTGLPVVRMETDADLDIDTVFAGSVVFYEDCGRQNWTVSSVFQANERGQTTRAFPKKGYRVNLITVTSTGAVNKNPRSILGMRRSDSWIFYAIYSDGTKVRDRFGIELWNGFGAGNTGYDSHYGTHLEYAELVVNGEYRGLYGIMEPVDCTQLQISDQEYLYKRTLGRELVPELFDCTSPDDYLNVLGMEIKGREGNGSRADWNCFRDYVELTEAPDETFSEGMEQLLDMGNATDMWLYLQMIYGEDNIYKNMFFAFKKEMSGYRMYLVPWDVDMSWGNVYNGVEEDLYTTYDPERAEQYLEWPMLDRMLALDTGGIRERVRTRWKSLRQEELSDGRMEETLQECIHLVQDSGAFERDAARWPDSAHDGDYDGIRTFMERRMNFLDKNIENMDEWIQE